MPHITNCRVPTQAPSFTFAAGGWRHHIVEMREPGPADARPVLFDAVLTPHRSLSRRGFWLLFAGFCCFSLAVGGYFFAIGAWPVFGFFGVDILLFYLFFRLSYRSADFCETVRLTPDELEVRRLGPGRQARRWTFQPNWLRVMLAEPTQNDTPLLLGSHGRTLRIGAFLSPEERLSLARALRDALQRWRSLPQGVGYIFAGRKNRIGSERVEAYL